MFDAIAKPFGWLMLFLYNLTHNYFFAVLLFALIVKLILLPFQMKSKRSMMRMSRLNPKMKELEKKHEGNKQKYQEAVTKLYKDEGVNPMSGCLWSLLPFPILLALYSAIRRPLTIMMGIAADTVTKITDFLTESGLYTAPEKVSAYTEINIANVIHNHFQTVLDKFPDLSGKLTDLNYNFLGMNFGETPTYKVWTLDFSDPASIGMAGLMIFPVASALVSYFSMKISNSTQPETAQTQGSMKGMMLTMPLVSLFIGFSFPAALSVYWLGQSAFSLIQDVILKKYYTKKLDEEDAERLLAEKAREAEIEQKRVETERLRAEGRLTQNENTSKKKLQQQERAKREAREAKERAEKRAAMGLTEQKPASQVGTRRYARGRAYVEDRYSNPETAEEQTALAASESEYGEAIESEPTDYEPTNRKSEPTDYNPSDNGSENDALADETDEDAEYSDDETELDDED